MSIILIISIIFASIVGMFIAWRALREDYISKLIFNCLFIIFLFTYFTAFVTYELTHNLSKTAISDPRNLWFWGGFLGFMIALVYASKKFRIKLNELFNGIVASWAVILMISLIPVNIYYALFMLLLLLIYNYLETHYRKFRWYRSGKIGFSGLFLFCLFFSFRAIVAIPFTDIIASVGKVDFIPSGIVAFLSAFSLYNMGKK